MLLGASIIAVAPLYAQSVGQTSSAKESDAAQGPATKSATNRLGAGFDLVTIYDDNIFATRNSKESDAILVGLPSLSYRIGNDVTNLNIAGSGEIGRYRDHHSENYNDWTLNADGRIQLMQGLQLLGGGDFRWAHESRSSPDAVQGLEPTRYRRAFGYAGLVGHFGAIAGRIGGTITGFDFSDVPTASGLYNNRDRDRTQLETGARLGYDLSPRLEVFAQGAFDRRLYRQKIDDAGYRRDSQGFSLAAGAHRQFGKNFDGEIFAGILRQNYKDRRFHDIKTVDFGGLLNWTGPNNVSAKLSLDRSIEETIVSGSSAYVITSASLGIGMMAGPRLKVGLDIDGENYDFKDIDRSDFVMSGDLWLRYWLTSRFYLGADYRLAQRASTSAGYDYDQNRVMLRIGMQLQPQYRGASGLAGQGRSGPYIVAFAGHEGLVTGLDGVRGNGANIADFGGFGGGGGAAFGYGLDLSPLYLGLEVDGIVGGADWQHESDRLFSVTKDNAFGIAARLGAITKEGNIIYGHAGISSTGFRTLYRTAGEVNIDDHRRLRGLEIGAGVEAAWGAHGFVRGEYILSSYPDYSIVSSKKGSDNFSSSSAAFRLGIGLRFGGAPSPAGQPRDFSGFYVGAGFGHGALASANTGAREGGSSLEATRAGQGPMLTIMAGGGVTIHRFYVAVETEGDIANLNWNIERDPLGRVYSAQHEWSYGVSALAGHLVSGSALFYGRVGIARTRFDMRYTTSSVSIRDGHTQSGLRLGAGLDVALNRSLRMRIDYSVTNYHAYELTYANLVDGFDNRESRAYLALILRI